MLSFYLRCACVDDKTCLDSISLTRVHFWCASVATGSVSSVWLGLFIRMLGLVNRMLLVWCPGLGSFACGTQCIVGTDTSDGFVGGDLTYVCVLQLT